MSSQTEKPTKSQTYYAKNKDIVKAKSLERYYVRRYDEMGIPRPTAKTARKRTPKHTDDEVTEMKVEMMKMMAYIIYLSQGR